MRLEHLRDTRTSTVVMHLTKHLLAHTGEVVWRQRVGDQQDAQGSR